MKTFTIIKIGYTCGVYGCSGEYFNLIINDGNGGEEYHSNNIFFQGMYGVEQRVAETLKQAGYKEIYTQSVFGQLKRRDVPKGRFLSEEQAIEEIKQALK